MADNRRIKIYELDGTSSDTTVVAEDVVYVPGFVNKRYINSENFVQAFVPTLCSTVAEFEQYFGSIPAVFETAQEWPAFINNAIPEDHPYMFDAMQMDPSYVYAKELLSAGLKVIYERVNTAEDGADITVQHMYDVLSETTDNDSIWQKLRDLGEFYEVKYLTSGGYPSFEYTGDMPIVKTARSNDDRLSEGNGISIHNREVLRNKLGEAAGNQNTIFQFIYAYERLIAIEVDSYAELDLYTEKALDYERYFVKKDNKDNKLYKINITEDDRTWVEIKENQWRSWWLRNQTNDTIEPVVLSAYGITSIEVPNELLNIGTYVEFECDVVENSPVVNAMLACAADRGDCVALIDHTDNPYRTLDPNKYGSVFYSATNANSKFKINVNGEFGAMFTPWCGITTSTKLNGATTKYIIPETMPGSFVYLKALAKSIQTNANWLAIAGAARGIVDITAPNITSTMRLSNAIAEDYQPRQGIAINPITNIKPYGYIIWGNRTLKNNIENLTATSFLNTRNIVSDVKKTAYLAARRCMFEQNSDILWLNYKARITPLLDKLVAGAGLSGYDLIKGETTEKAKLVCVIRLYPIYAVEAFEITVELADQEVTVS